MNLLALRLNMGLSPAEAAERIGIARGTLRRAETGEMLRAGTAKRIADFYGVRVTDIWPVYESEGVAA